MDLAFRQFLRDAHPCHQRGVRGGKLEDLVAGARDAELLEPGSKPPRHILVIAQRHSSSRSTSSSVL